MKKEAYHVLWLKSDLFLQLGTQRMDLFRSLTFAAHSSFSFKGPSKLLSGFLSYVDADGFNLLAAGEPGKLSGSKLSVVIPSTSGGGQVGGNGRL